MNFTTNIVSKKLQYRYIHIRLLGFCFFTYYSYKGKGWVRIFGRIIEWRDIRKTEPVFSERYGYVKHYKFGNYKIKEIKW